MPREHHMTDVVIAVSAQGLPELRVGFIVGVIAPLMVSVRALVVSIPSRVAAAGGAGGVYGTETRCGQGHEYLRMLCDGGGDVVMAAAQAGVDELPSVP